MRNANAIRLLIRLACFLPFAGALLLVNWIGGQHLVRRRFTAPLDAAAEALVAGKTIVAHIDTLDLKPIWIEHLRCQSEVIVLGSSRVVQIRHEWFGPRTMLNLSLLAGDFADAVSLFQKYLDTGKTPKLVLLELNPTLTFEERTRPTPALAPYYRRTLLRYGIFSPDLLSGPLTLDAFRWNPVIFLGRHPWKVSDAMEPGASRIRPDGSADWSDIEAPETADQVERDVRSRIHSLDPQYQHWRMTSRPDWFSRKLLEGFLDDLHARGIRVAVMLVPVHPTAYDFYSRQGGYDDSWIRHEMAQRGIAVVGTYSPSAAKATRDDFYDDVHAHPAVLHRLLAEGGIVE